MKKRRLKRKAVVNMNYPPEDMPKEEIERFWGEITEEDIRWAKELKKKLRKDFLEGKDSAKPSVV